MAKEGNNNAMTAAIIVGGVLLMYDKIFGKSDSEKKAADEEKKLLSVPQAKNPTLENYKPNKAPKGYVYIRKNLNNTLSSAAIQIKKQIGNGIYVDQNNANTIIAMIKRALTKSEINVLWRTYNSLYKRDLTTDLQTNLTPENITRVYEYINGLPDYIKA